MFKSLKESFNSPDSYVSLALGLAVVLVVGMIAVNYFRARMQPGITAEQQLQQEASAAAKLPAKYVVKAGDTLWSIAESYYKSGYNWIDLVTANNLTNADRIEEGVELIIPDVKPIVLPAGQISNGSAVQLPEKRQVTVVEGDSLWLIAQKIYGSGYKWVDIARVNSLANPDLIYPGAVLALP